MEYLNVATSDNFPSKYGKIRKKRNSQKTFCRVRHVTFIFVSTRHKKNPIRVCQLFRVFCLLIRVWHLEHKHRSKKETERQAGEWHSRRPILLFSGLRFYLDPARKACTIPNLHRRFLVGVLVFVPEWKRREALREGGREEEMAGGELDNGVTSSLSCWWWFEIQELIIPVSLSQLRSIDCLDPDRPGFTSVQSSFTSVRLAFFHVDLSSTCVVACRSHRAIIPFMLWNYLQKLED